MNDSLNVRLNRTRRLLEILLDQKAGYVTQVPPELQLQIEEQQRRVAEIEKELGLEPMEGAQESQGNTPSSVGAIGNQGTIGNATGTVQGNQVYVASGGQYVQQPAQPPRDNPPSGDGSLRPFRIAIASPGDVQPERDVLVNSVIPELNQTIAPGMGLVLQYRRWEDVAAKFDPEGSQTAIEKYLQIESCQVLVCIFWKRFGFPTPDGRTGTEREFDLAFEAWKGQGSPQIMVYFNEASYTLKNADEAAQVGKVLDFKQRLQKEGYGLYRTYDGAGKFEGTIRPHLIQTLQELQQQRQH